MFRRLVRAVPARLALVLALVAPAAILGGGPAGAQVACGGFTSTLGQCINAGVTVGTTSYNADWYLPNATPVGFMLMQHGFARGCGNLRNTARAAMEKGLVVLCLNANMTGGNPTLGTALADALAAGTIVAPGGRTVPNAVVVGGHSAGGHFAGVVGARLATVAPARLGGAVLFDAVASEGFSANLAAISSGGTRPVLQIASRPNAGNLANNAFGALTALPNAFVGVQLVWTGYLLGVPYGGSCHTDAEGENGDLVGNVALACTPHAPQTARLRALGSTWARDLATGTRTSAYWCTDGANRNTCGSKVSALVGGWLPVASLIPVR